MEDTISSDESLSLIARNEWMAVMADELDSMAARQLIDFPCERKCIDNKWVLKVKHKVDGSIEKHKALLMVKGYT